MFVYLGINKLKHMAIGFPTPGTEDDNDRYEGKTFEDYNHTIRLFGIPIYVSTKKHIVDTQSKGKPQQ